MCRARWPSFLLYGSLFLAVPTFAAAERHTVKEWRVQKLAPLFPHVPDSRWVYAVSGRQYPNGGELHVQVKGQQYVPALKQRVLLFEEIHPQAAVGTSPEAALVLYYPKNGYLVRDTSHQYANLRPPAARAAKSLGGAVTPVLPLWRDLNGSDWNPVALEHWGKASTPDISYRVDPKKRVSVTVRAGAYTDCVLVEGTVKRTPEDGYNYQEWYAPGVGLVRRVASDMRTGEILLVKELLSFQPASSPRGKKQSRMLTRD